MRLMHQVMFATDVEGELVIGFLMHRSDFLDQRDHIHPLEIVRRRVPKQGFERPTMRTVQRHGPLGGRGLTAFDFIGFHRRSVWLANSSGPAIDRKRSLYTPLPG